MKFFRRISVIVQPAHYTQLSDTSERYSKFYIYYLSFAFLASLCVVCYNEGVHKPFYASGFLYYPPSRQILLQQLNKDTKEFVLFRGKSSNGTDPKKVFRISVEKVLGIAIPEPSIQEVYDYTHDKLGNHFIYYAEVTDKSSPEFETEYTSGWLLLSKLSKYSMSEQARHDIIIGERVIRSLITT